MPSNAQIRAQTRLVDRHAPSSQLGGQGFESPQLHRYHRRQRRYAYSKAQGDTPPISLCAVNAEARHSTASYNLLDATVMPVKPSPVSSKEDEVPEESPGGPQGVGAELSISRLRYQEAVRGIDNQRGALRELRARTGMLITAATISSSFLGSTAATGHPGFPVRFLWGIIPFGISIGLALIMLMPWPGWYFMLRGKTFKAYTGEPEWKITSALAGILDKNIDSNQKRLDLMSICFAASAIALLVSIIAWIDIIE